MGAQDVGGAGGDQVVQLSAHGGRPGDQRVTQNGFITSSLFRPDTDTTYTPNLGNTQEVAIDTSGLSADASQGGIRINLIPKKAATASEAPCSPRSRTSRCRATTSLMI
jgi:hypothetical protein